MNYEERQEFKLDRCIGLSKKAEHRSQLAYNRSYAISDCMAGSPILVGHYSEKRHRRDIERIGDLMDKGKEEKEKSEYYQNKVKNILNPLVISSDDPEAINKLKDKLSGLEVRRDKIKEKNKELKKEGKDKLPAYVLSNLAGNIKSVKDRIQYLENLKAIPDIEETINGVVLKTDKDDNRIKLFFPDIPNEEIRMQLKRNGFRWSPFNKCWQAYLREWNVVKAKEILKGGI